MPIAPWSVGGVCLKINPDHEHSILRIGGVYLKLNPIHDHGTWKCWWCPSQRLSELKAETNEYFYQLY